MKTNIIKISSIILFLLMIFNVMIINVSAGDASEQVECFKSYNNKIICVAHRGDWHSFPENSAEAIRAAVEYGTISVDVKLTSDKKAVLMADETLDRMCVNSDEETVRGNVSDFSLEQIKELYLRNGNGGVKNEPSEIHPASLKDAIEIVGDDAALMLNLKCADFNIVYNEIVAMNMLEKVVFRFPDDMKTIADTIASVDDITVCGNYQGNIIFLATGAVKTARENGIATIELGSKNGKGVLYDNFLMNRFDAEGKAMVSMVNGRCGKRTDNETGWDDLVSRGYSVIETDYPNELNAYIEKIDYARGELQKYLDLYGGRDTDQYTTDSENAYVSAVGSSENLLCSVASLSQLDNARFDLQSSFDNLTVGAKKKVTLSFEFTWGRFAAAFLCGAAVLVSQILLLKRREKRKDEV